MWRWIFLLITIHLLTACATNPLTGGSDLILVPNGWDEQVGAQQYAPARQSQGGDFVLDPELVAYVRGVGQRVAAQSPVGYPYEFNVLNSSVPNAWALPSGKIAINRGLLTELESEAELAAVLGHEVVHADARHGARAQSRGLLTSVGAVAVGVGVGVGTDDPKLGQVALLGASVGSQLLNQKHGRDAERESDLYGIEYMAKAGYDPRGAIHLQEKFVKLSEGRRQDWISGLFASHPPSQERVENNRRVVAQMPAGGELGRERYQKMMAPLRKAQPAYDAYDEAQQALQEGDTDKAKSLVAKAKRIEPKEALFHSLEGDIFLKQEKYRDAERAYSRAIKMNPDWFYFHLRRGQVREELNQLDGARTDLQRSNRLLDTGVGRYYLGVVERRAGNRNAAIENLRIAQQAGGDIGQQANQELRTMGVNG